MDPLYSATATAPNEHSRPREPNIRARPERTGNGRRKREGRLAAPFAGTCSTAEADYTRRLYSPVRVSTSMRSPVVTNSGTCTSKPLLSFAGFITLPDVSPLTAGSV